MIRRKVSLLLAILMVITTMTVGFTPTAAGSDNGITTDLSAPYMEDEYEEIRKLKQKDQADPENTEPTQIHRESLYTKTTDNGDGTKTLEVYGEPVRYRTEDGSVKDISLTPVRDGAGFRTGDHRLSISFPEKAEDGITLNTGEHVITATPVTENGTAVKTESALLSDTDAIVYRTDPKTSYEYSITYSGYKENIVVSEYTGQTDFLFRLETDGLLLAASEGDPSRGAGLELKDTDGKTVARISDIIVFSSDNRNNTFGDISYETVAEGGEYILRVSLSAEYLSDPNTHYPIYIDPTITTITVAYDANNNSTWNDIEDITVNQNQAADPPTSGTLYVGKAGADYGAMRSVMRFPELELYGIIPGNITSATVKVRDLMCYGFTLQVDCYGYGGTLPTGSFTTANMTWSAVYNTMQYYESSNLYRSTNNISYSNGSQNTPAFWYEFNILPIVQEWAQGRNSGTLAKTDQAIVFKSTDSYEQSTSTQYVCFGSYDRASYKPSLTITYYSTPTISVQSGVYAISRQHSSYYATSNTITGGTYLPQQQFTSVPASESVRNGLFKIVYRPSNDDYVIRNMRNNEVVVYANPGYNAPLTWRLQYCDDDDVPIEKAWKISTTNDGFYNIYCTISGTTYYWYMPASGNLELTTNPNQDGAKWSLHHYEGTDFRGWEQVGTWPEHIENGSSATVEACIYSTVIGENSAWLVHSDIDPDVATVNWSYSTCSQLEITPKYGGNTKIRIEADIGEAVFGYYYLVSGWDTGSFFIKNKFSSEYLTLLDGLSDSELRLTYLPNGDDKEYTLWNMVYWANGYYQIIQDVVGDCVYGNNPIASNLKGKPWANNVWQQTLWKFIPQSDGSFKIQSYYHEANNPNNYVSLDNTATKNIRSLSDTGNKQLWYITPVKFNVKILYDQAFIDKNGSTGYMAVLSHVFGDNSIENSIEQALYDQLGIRFSFTYTSTSSSTFLSYPYYKECLVCNNRAILCENHSLQNSDYDCCSSGHTTMLYDCENGLHHKRWNCFGNNMPSSSSYIPILFTGHIGCGVNTKGTTDTTDDEHVGANVAGYANYLGGTSIVILSQGEVASTGDWSSRLLLHEIIHIFNAPDNTQNYTEPTDENYDPTREYRMNCVMGYNRNSATVMQNLTICDYCKNIAKMYKYSFVNH